MSDRDDWAGIPASPAAKNITDGVDTSPLDDLTVAQRNVLTVLMARLAERSYRRGFQQGAVIATNRPSDLPSDFHAWRYRLTTDISLWGDRDEPEDAVERLLGENRSLGRLGFKTEFRWVGEVDREDAADRLFASAAALRASVDNPRRKSIARVSLIALGVELNTTGGPKALSTAYDDVWDKHGAEALIGVNSAWEGIGGWRA